MQSPVINIEDIPSSIKEFFSAEEFAIISDYEKQTCSNLRQNFEALRRFGFPVDPPEFMLKNRSVKEKDMLTNSPIFDSSDGSDMEWTPAIEIDKKPQANKRQTLHNTSKKTCSENDTSNNNKMLMPSKLKKQREKQTKIESKEEDIQVYPSGKKMITSYMSLAIPDEEDFLYCVECNNGYIGNCPFYGSLLPVRDTEATYFINSSNTLEYSKRTLPDGLEIKKSLIPKAGLGVFAIKDFPVRSRFGPYRGKIEKIAQESGYSWQVMRDGQTSHFVDARDSSESNWMRFVNCARHEDEQCLTAFQYKGEIYYRSHKQILAGSEILVYYGESYSKDLGIQIQQFGERGRKVQEQADTDSRPVVNKDNDKIYSCTKCHLSFSEFGYLHKHMKYKHGNSNLQLQNSSANINENHNAPVSNLQNEICNSDLNKAFSLTDKHVRLDRADLNDHIGIDKESNITKRIRQKCDVHCVEKKTSISCPETRKRIHTGEKPYKCDVCGAAFTQSGPLLRHKRIHTGEKPYKCDVCGLMFTRSEHLRKHKRIHAGEKPYKCDVCGLMFTRSEHLLVHKKIHTGEKPYNCDVCSVCFTHSGDLVRHKRIHTGEKPYKCDVCNVGFTRRGGLLVHKRLHTGEKLCRCDVCGAAFTVSGHLLRHTRIHTGEKPYKCDVCGLMFTRSEYLRKHKRIHTGEKPYKCDVCGLMFTRSEHLLVHKKIQTGEKPYKCDVCSVCFTHSGDLVRHKRIHTGEKPYKCDVCGVMFTQSGPLLRHKRIHTGEKPYKCDVCNVGFTRRGNLLVHKRIHTGEKP